MVEKIEEPGDRMSPYFEMVNSVLKLQRLLMDVIQDEFKRVGLNEVNPVQALLLSNIGDNEVTAGELRSRGYYQGSNVSYNLKKLVSAGYVHQRSCESDRRLVYVKLTDKGQGIRSMVNTLFERRAADLNQDGELTAADVEAVSRKLQLIAEGLSRQIRYLY